MRLVAWIFGILLVLFLGTYSVLWYIQGQAIKNAFVEASQNLPKISAERSGTEMKLTYDDLKVGGFPFRHTVEYQNPTISWRARNNSGIKPFAPMPGAKKINTMTLNGSLQLDSNYLTHTYSVVLSGNLSGNVSSDKGSLDFSSEWEGPATGSMKLSRASTLMFLQGKHPLSLLNSKEDFIRTVRDIRFHAKNTRMKRISDGKQIFFAPESSGSLTLNPVDETYLGLDIHLLSKDVLSSKEYMVFIAGLPFVNKDGGTLAHLDERAGKTTLEADVTMTGPFMVDGPTPEAYDLDIEAKKFSLHNDWYEITLPLIMNVHKTPEKTDFTIKHQGVIRFSEEMESALRTDYLISGVAYEQMKKMFENEGKEIPAPATLDLSGLFPEISRFGAIKTVADIASDETQTHALIHRLGVTSDLYGISAKGKTGITEESADILIDCTQCLQMLDDAASYYNRTQDLLRQLHPEAKYPVFSAAQIEALKQLISSLDTDAAAQDVISMHYEQKGATRTLSGRPMEQLVIQLMTIFSTPQASTP